MFVKLRRMRKCYRLQLLTTCLVVSLVMVCWQELDGNMVSHIKSYSSYLINPFAYINQSLTIPREQARRFSNFSFLLDHRGKCTGQDVLLLLFIKTSPENSERRKAIRSTWGNETYIQSALGATVKVVFALGLPRTRAEEPTWSKRSGHGLQEQLVLEDRLHGDLIQQDFLDSFHNLTLKLIMQFRWMHSRCAHARFLMTADDDIFIHMPNLVRYLREASSSGVSDFWVGRVHSWAPPIRDKESKYYVSHDMYEWSWYPDYTAGAGYVVSGDVADRIYQATLTLNASIYIDDVFMGICANAIGVAPREHVFFAGERKAPYHLCIYRQMMTSHGHVDDIYELWRAATHPRVERGVGGLMDRLYCTAVKISLLCRPYFTYPCKAAFS
ncbi:lactosylceramide 1,3-N-acetyl-beta-D-glucosaminyltransferase B [Betta splendens]|uniref:Hexosyltransferase n=1 Tax=Betta splendens TaxID=158456 RepID=A0A6P7L6V0_BETSP|nr:lactosylceramide 1,3-N-acetyl-beta-D-glucosaminyltransferase B [Betta splendens]